MNEEDMQRLSDEFDEMCRARHEMGAEKYGPVKFLEIDSWQMMLEEITDLANYARYTFIKIRLLQEGTPAVEVEIIPGSDGFMGRGRGRRN
jgi:hypothetical protein